MELVRAGTPNRSGVRRDRAKSETEPIEDPGVASVHFPVGFLETRLVRVERIGVLHHELARAHDAETRPDFVAEFGLDLV